jgi:uncharacterized protein Smg (DUF494 family)
VSERSDHDGVQRLLRLVGDKLEEYLDGDEMALETLGEAIEEGGWSAEELQSAILAIRALSGANVPPAWIAGRPGRHAARVPSSEERESLSTEAWGYLLDLQRQGALDPEQFERVLDLLVGCGVRPVSVELARDVASRVALEHDDGGNSGDGLHGDVEVAH